ncbi:MAG TPA: ABC transporter permease [Candidatus Saccharimonadales bacterium]|nr:ABC transporter permease [Candidatus Saccharimonadales bacterium]
MSFWRKLYYQYTDTWAITKRNLLRYIRLPRLIFFSSIQPIIFLTLFNFVFGGALGKSGAALHGKYINYLLPGIMVQVTLFGGLQTGVGLATDLSSGIIDRFRSLPMSRAAVLAGRTIADMLRNVIVIGIMLAYGYALGFRFYNGFWNALAMVALMVLFGFAFSWVAAFLGMLAKDPETAQLSGFLFVFPLVFASAAFVPVATMAKWLQHFANNQPITFATNAARSLALGLPGNGAIWKMLVWVVAILVVFVPLSIRVYRKRA